MNDAFISYSHAADGRLAPALRDGLQRLAKKWNERRALRVFLDESALETSPDLWQSIQRELDESSFLILLASPASAESRWVNREVARWLDNGGADRLLLVLTDGDLLWDEGTGGWDEEASSALPPALATAYGSEPAYLDLRWAHADSSQLDLRHSRFRNAVADLAAPIHGTDRDELEGEDIRQHRRTRRITRVAIGALLTLLVFTIVAGMLALLNARSANRRALEAESLLLGAQAENLANSGERLDLALLVAAEGYLASPTPDARAALRMVLDAVSQVDVFLHGHDGPIRSIAYSDDGALLVSGGLDGTVRLWDPATGAQLGPPLLHHTDAVRNAVFSPAGDDVASVGFDGKVVVWDVESRAATVVFHDPEIRLFALAWSPAGNLVAAAGDGGAIHLIDTDTWTPAGPPLQAHGDFVLDLAFNADGSQLASGSDDGTAIVWDVERREALDVLDPGWDYVTSVAFDPNEPRLVTTGPEAEVVVWELRSEANPEATLAGHTAGPVRHSAFSADGERLFTAGAGRAVAMWDVDAGTMLWRSTVHHSGDIRRIAVHPSGTRLATGGDDGTIIVWRVGDPRSEGDLMAGSKVFSLSLGPSGVIYAGEPPQPAAVPDVQYAGADSWVVAAAPDGEKMAIGYASGDVEVIADDPDQPVAAWSHSAPVRALAFGPEGTVVASGGEDSTVVVWDVDSDMLVGEPIDVGAPVFGADFAPDGELLAVTAGNEVILIDPEPVPAIAGRLSGHTQPVLDVAFSPRGDLLVSAAADATLRAWDPATGAAIGAPVLGHGSGVTSIAFSADGSTVATADRGGTIRLWDVPSLRPVGPAIAAHDGIAWTLGFGPDDDVLWSGGDDGLERWDLSPIHAVETACLVANRTFTPEEWASYGQGRSRPRVDCAAAGG